tara:strand:+ start:179 stop:376 length:198 start_codon:yes stop_codon:yes gene_type:complete
MQKFIILDRSKKESVSFVSNVYKISGLVIPEISKNPKDAKSFRCRNKAQNYLNQIVDPKKNFFII